MFDQMAGGEWEVVPLKPFLDPILMCVGGEGCSPYITKQFPDNLFEIQLISGTV